MKYNLIVESKNFLTIISLTNLPKTNLIIRDIEYFSNSFIVIKYECIFWYMSAERRVPKNIN